MMAGQSTSSISARRSEELPAATRTFVGGSPQNWTAVVA